MDVLMNVLSPLTISKNDTQNLIERLKIRASIRRQIPTRKSVLENKPDRISDLLEEAATYLERYMNAES